LGILRATKKAKYKSANFQTSKWCQKSKIVKFKEELGYIAVYYSKKMPTCDEGPFLKEERNLINAVAREVSLIIERKDVEDKRMKLENQLLHADRLATIGQLAAGVAHELNEPLGNILGFAQLIAKNHQVPSQAVADLDKITQASLHAREIVKKLLLFSRQKVPQVRRTNLNQVVEEGLYFLKARCAKEGIQLIVALAPTAARCSRERSCPGRRH